MEHVQFAGTGRRTSRLGFGCSALMGGNTRRESVAILDAAWDAGIRHFDVAPMYGWGAAESCVGEFLRSKSGQATVTSKYGIQPPPRQALAGIARKAVRPVIRALPGIKQRLARAASAAFGGSQEAMLNAKEARASLDRSRKALQKEYIDLWLLHDMAAARLTDPEILEFMQEAVAKGAIGDFGVSHDVAEIPALYEQKREYCHVLQFEWSVRQLIPEFPASFRIHHRSLAHNYSAMRAQLMRRPELCRQWSSELDCDLNSAEKVSALMLKAALMMNPRSIVLVSSTNPLHIAANATTAEDSSLESAALRFYELVQLGLKNPGQEAETGADSAGG